MDEQGWFASDYFYDLLTIPQTRDDRKRRLVSCAIGRTVLRLFSDPQPWEEAIEFCERWADGEFDQKQWTAMRKSLRSLEKDLDQKQQLLQAANTIRNITEKKYMDFKMAHESAAYALGAEGRANRKDGENDPYYSISEATDRAHLLLVHEVYGNPFQTIEIDSSVLSWKGSAVQQIADEIYKSGDFHSLGVLGDALTEAGCRNEEVVSHCYQEGHVRGCWVIDLIRTQ